MTTQPRWEERFNERFGCRPVSLEELGAAEERGTPLLYPIQGDAVKKFISETLQADRAHLAEKTEAIRAKAHNGEDVYNDIVALIRSSREG